MCVVDTIIQSWVHPLLIAPAAGQHSLFIWTTFHNVQAFTDTAHHLASIQKQVTLE